MPCRVGTSGWQYADWRGVLYPPGLAQQEWLSTYARSFPSVEVNNAFYRLPERQVFERWRDATPAGFVFAVKASRFITHVKRLAEPEGPVARLMDRACGLGDRLGPVLLQLPPNLRAVPQRLDTCLRAFPEQTRVAVEPRHDTWWSDEVATVLRTHRAALCWADRLGRPVTPLWRTAEFGYVRMHEGAGSPWPRYDETTLESWVARLRAAFPAGEDVFVYFNNDRGGAAVYDARAFARLTR